MPVVFIPSPLRELADGQAEVSVPGNTVLEVIDSLEERFPGIKARLCRGNALVPGIQVWIDHTMVTRRGLRAELSPTSEVHFLPAIAGGAAGRRWGRRS